MIGSRWRTGGGIGIVVFLIVVNASPSGFSITLAAQDRSISPSATNSGSLKIAPSSIGYVRVRKDPHTNGAVVGHVKPGEVYAFSTVRHGWYWLEAKHGWISGRYVSVQDVVDRI